MLKLFSSNVCHWIFCRGAVLFAVTVEGNSEVIVQECVTASSQKTSECELM